MRVLNQSTQKKPQYLPQISLIYADEPQKKRPNRNNLITISNCLSLRDNAACCIPLRDLRYLRENNTQEYSINLHRRNPNVSRWSRRFTQTNNKQQNNKTALTSPTCLSLRNNAACCIPLRHLRYLRRIYIQTYSINIHRRNPSISRWSRRFTQTKPKTTKQHKPHALQSFHDAVAN